jgi:glycosyltransferase involved in cell wall biosynthesis
MVSQEPKKKICMIAYTQYSWDARLRREAETLVSHPEYEVVVLSLKEFDHARYYIMDGVAVDELNLRQYRGKNTLKYFASYFRFLLLSFLYCSRIFFRSRIDVVHVHNMPDFVVFAAAIPRLFGRKLVLDIHDSMPETLLTKFSNTNRFIYNILCWEEAASCKFANRIICVNEIQRNALIRRGIPARKIDVCMNVPDHKRFNLKESLKFRRSSHNGFKLVYHGTQSKRLGVDLVIRAVARLVAEIPDLQFHVIGTGDDLEEFIKLSEAIRVEKSVHFSKNNLPVQNLVTMLAEMDMGIVANRKSIATELMLPVKMMEYIALEIPVVAPRLKTIQYYFDDDMVTYFEPEDMDSLTGAIRELYSNEAKRKRQIQSAKKFLELYGWEIHQYDLINLYRNL